MSQPAPVITLRDRAGAVVATATILAIMYLARGVLVPITLAVILSLLIAPLVRALRRLGIGSTSSVFVAVLLLAVCFAWAASVIGIQVARMAASLPQYEQTIRLKLTTLNAITLDRLNTLTSQAGRLLGEHEQRPTAIPAPTLQQPSPPEAPSSAQPLQGAPTPLAPTMAAPSRAAPSRAAPIPVELHQPPATPLQLIEKVLASVWAPLQTAGIVLVVLVFVLLEREALRDRFIRIAGATDLRGTTLALNDAGERLSRFFVSQFAVNLGVGIALWIGLTLIGLPHALLWAALAALLRFVPYVGLWIAALFATILAAAVDPGWSLAIKTLASFVIVDAIAGQLVEPQLYGHTTGLSPLSVVIAAIFWSWLWGPVGLILSTPLTMCLVVAGRHIQALSLLDILLSDNQALTMPQRVYQRALSADSDEIIASARTFLKQQSFTAYADRVLMPALHLAGFDLGQGAISPEQQIKVRSTIVAVIEALGGEGRKPPWRRRQESVLDQMSAGRLLRQRREQQSGRWQGPVVVPPGSVILCLGLGLMADDLATELLVRILRDRRLDARHFSLEELHQGPPPPEASPAGVGIAYLLSAYPDGERKGAGAAAEVVRRRFPDACLVAVFLPGSTLLQPGSITETLPGADHTVTSLGEAVQLCLDLLRERTRTDANRS
jgi:predicted PurR-regulated permease PerM